jgi:hypothetical protein
MAAHIGFLKIRYISFCKTQFMLLCLFVVPRAIRDGGFSAGCVAPPPGRSGQRVRRALQNGREIFLAATP